MPARAAVSATHCGSTRCGPTGLPGCTSPWACAAGTGAWTYCRSDTTYDGADSTVCEARYPSPATTTRPVDRDAMVRAGLIRSGRARSRSSGGPAGSGASHQYPRARRWCRGCPAMRDDDDDRGAGTPRARLRPHTFACTLGSEGRRHGDRRTGSTVVPGVEGSLTDSGAGEVAMTEQRPAEPAREGTELTLLRLTADIAEELVGIDGLDRAAQHTADLVARRGVADVVGLSGHSRHGPARRLGSSNAGLAALDRVASASLMTPRDVLLADGQGLLRPATREEARWPEGGAATATAGLHSALFVGMPPARTDVTVLELYGRR